MRRAILYLRARMNTIHSICVYCGSSTGSDPIFEHEARRLATMLVGYRIRLINGGGSIGLMGVMADTVMEKGGEAIGIIPSALEQLEVAHTGMSRLIVVPDMHARKQKMLEMSDAFIALPGGFGTMDEVFEMLTWAQLHIHAKPIILYNLNGYYDMLLAQADHMMRSGFLSRSSRRLMMSTSEIEMLVPMLLSFKHEGETKWQMQ